MANVFVEEDSLKAIGAAIRETGGTAGLLKPAEMAEAVRKLGGIQPEGSLRAVPYKSAGQLRAPAEPGRFVSLYPEFSQFTQRWSSTSFDADCFDAVRLDGRRVFLAYANTQGDRWLYCCVLTVYPFGYHVGDIVRAAASVTGPCISAAALDSDRVLVTYAGEGGVDACVVTVNGNGVENISDAATILSGSLQWFEAGAAGQNSAEIFYCEQTGYPAMVRVAVGTDGQVSTVYDSGGGWSGGVYMSAYERPILFSLGDLGVLAVYNHSDTLVCRLDWSSGFGYSEGAVQGIGSGSGVPLAGTRLADGRFFIVYARGDNTHGAVLRVDYDNDISSSGLRVTVEGYDLNLMDLYSAQQAIAATLEDGRVLVLAHVYYAAYWTAVIAQIDVSETMGVTVTAELHDTGWYTENGDLKRLLRLPGGDVAILGMNGSDIGLLQNEYYASLFHGMNCGLVKTTGGDGDTIEVYVPVVEL